MKWRRDPSSSSSLGGRASEPQIHRATPLPVAAWSRRQGDLRPRPPGQLRRAVGNIDNVPSLETPHPGEGTTH